MRRMTLRGCEAAMLHAVCCVLRLLASPTVPFRSLAASRARGVPCVPLGG